MKKLIFSFITVLWCSIASAQINTNGLFTNQISRFPNLYLPTVLTNAAAYTPGTNAQVFDLLTGQLNTIYVWMTGAGTNSSSAGAVTIAWEFSPDGTNWLPTIQTTALTASGTNNEITVNPLLVSNCYFMKMLYITNADATYSFPSPTVIFVPHR